MSTLTLIAVLLCLASAFGFVNHRLLRLPTHIGVMTVALAAASLALLVDAALPQLDLREWLQELLGTEQLPAALLNGALAFLLFAGALHVDMAVLWNRKITVFLLATIGVVIATVLFGAAIWWVFWLVGIAVPLAWCLVLGAILAPTDPVALAALLRETRMPQNVQAVMAGESLFNDGVAVVVFSAMLAIATDGAVAPATIALDFARQLGGGLAIGAATGWIVFQVMRRVDEYPLEIMMSLALAAGTYALADALGASGPIAVVVAGLLIGTRGKRDAMSERTRNNLSLFWSVIDDLLNALLFLLLGFELLGLRFDRHAPIAAACAILVSPLVRAASIVLTTFWLHARNPERWPAVAVLTWGGLRGAISVALALSLPPSPWRNGILFVCYAIVVFTILVQGTTMRPLVSWVYGARGEKAEAARTERRSRSRIG